MKLLRILNLIMLSVMILSCGCSQKAKGEDNGYKMTSIYVKTTEMELQVGDKVAVKAYPVPSMAVPPAFQWTSDNNDVATVTAGTIHAVGVGEATVSVSYQDLVTNISVTVKDVQSEGNLTAMYSLAPNTANQDPLLQVGDAGSYTDEGLLVNRTGARVMLNKFYALAEREVRYEIVPSADAVVNFCSSQGDFNSVLDMQNRTITIRSNPTAVSENVPFLEGGRTYVVEVIHQYQRGALKVTDSQSGQTAIVSAVMDGPGGCGKGALQQGFSVGMQWDHYCFVLEKGESVLVRRMGVFALKNDVRLLIYGDSISQPEGYFPTADFPRAWTSQIIAALGGNAMSSGRGGGTIDTVLEYIKNELPYLKTKYVMVTIGTNGGNTEEKLRELVNYIKDQGAIPILNNTPCNESATQIENNALISKVRDAMEIKGCLFDLCTSLAGDGKEVDKSMMYWEDYTDYPAPLTGWQIYHHPNEKGGDAMYKRTLIDIPEIYQ